MNIPLKFIRFWIVSFSKWEFSNSLLYLLGSKAVRRQNALYTTCSLNTGYNQQLVYIMIKRIISKRLLNTLVHVNHNYSLNLYTVLQSFTLIHRVHLNDYRVLPA